MGSRDQDDWDRRYQTFIENASVPPPETSAVRRDFLFYVVGLGVLFALVGLVGGPVDWQSPSGLQRLGNFGIMFGIGALLGLRLFSSRPKD